MFFDIKAINFGGKRILRSLGAALFLFVVFVLLYVLLSHVSIRLAAPVEELRRKAFVSNMSYQVERPKGEKLPQVHIRGLAPELLIGKVTLHFQERDQTSAQALWTHDLHDKSYEYSIFLT